MNADHHKLVEELFLKVCDLSTDQRARVFANDAYRDHPDICKQVERMIDAEQQSALDMSTTDSTRIGAFVRLDQPHTQIGRYAVEHEVARGGMGTIYKVRDQQLKRSLALKVMRPTSPECDPQSRSVELARFMEEARITAQLDHPGIVPVHDMWNEGDPEVFFTMSLVKGNHLGEVIEFARKEENDWNLARALGVVLKACDAIAYAHSRNVIHRDLKPSNIMVGRFGAVYVMDWGLAKVADEEDVHDIRPRRSDVSRTRIQTQRRGFDEHSSDSPLITMDGSVVGTPAYMPPEQAKGLVEEVDAASDVYSLGAVLYSLLTGQPPYVEPGSRLSPHTILGMVIQGPPTPISKLSPQAPAELVAICERAMARDKSDRYESSSELAEDLQAYLDGRVVKAFETGAIAELKSWLLRNRGSAAAICVSVLGIFLAAAFLNQVSHMRTVGEKNQQLNMANRQLDSANQILDRQNKQIQTDERQLQYDLDVGAAMRGWDAGFVGTVREQLQRHIPEKNQPDDFRGFEWFYIDNLCKNSENALLVRLPHNDIVTAIGFSDDDASVATGCDDGIIRIWDGEGELVKTFPDRDENRLSIRQLMFVDSNSKLVSVDDEGGIRIRSVDREGQHRLVGSATDAFSIALSTNERYIAGLGENGAVNVWELDKVDSTPRIITLPNAYATRFAFDPYGEYLAVGGSDGSVRLWNCADLSIRKEIKTDVKLSKAVSDVAVSEDGKLAVVDGDRLRVFNVEENTLCATATGRFLGAGGLWFAGDRLAVSADDGIVRIYQVGANDLQLLNSVYGHEDPVIELRPRQSAVSKFVSYGGANNELLLWDGARGRVDATLHGHANEIYCMSVSPTGDRIATGGRDYCVSIWNANTRHPATILEGHVQCVRSVAFVDGREGKILTSDSDGRIRIWDSASGEVEGVLGERVEGTTAEEYHEEVTTLAVSSNGSGHVEGNRIASISGYDGLLKTWDWSTRKYKTQKPKAHLGGCCLAFSPSGDHIVTGGHDGRAIVWTYPELAQVSETYIGSYAVYSVDVSSAGIVAIGGTDSNVRLWNWRDGEDNVRILKGHTGRVASVRFTQDGTKLASGAHDGTIRLWDVEAGAELQSPLSPLQGHTGDVVGLAFAPDGKSLASASFDKTVRFWNIEKGRMKCVLNGHRGWVHCLAFSPDGKTLATGGWDATARVWRTSATSKITPPSERLD